jgi:hypothetical protein
VIRTTVADALWAVLFAQQCLDEVGKTAADDKTPSTYFDALDLFGHHKLVRSRPSEADHFGCLFYREQELGIHVLLASFAVEGGA